MWTGLNDKFLLCLLAVSLMQIMFVYLNICSVLSNSKEKSSPFRETDVTNDYMNVCALPIYDFWDSSIQSMIDPSYDPTTECKMTQPMTELVNGSWRITSDQRGFNCAARCHLDVGDNTTAVRHVKLPGPVRCEFLETVCKNKTTVYGYIHTQVIPKPQDTSPKFENPPNVFLILLDSMSTGQAVRSFPRTLKFLKSEMELIEFPFVSKVGENSRPNGYTLLFGKSTENVNNTLYGGKVFKSEWSYKRSCSEEYLDNTTHLFKEFREHGYMTMDAEDWARSVVNWPQCLGFKNPPTHHHMHPFQLAYERTGVYATRHHLNGSKTCRETYHPVMEYFQQFLDAYKNRPMFSWKWLTNLGHDELNGLMRFDKVLLELLKKNQKLFDDSFFIFMGDHGLRRDYKFLQTEIGDLEVNNPYFSMTVPKKYRNSGIVEEMRKNAQKLQTHYDTRATILDILKFQPTSNFTETSLLNIAGERGHSYFRRQPSFPRTCGQLPIMKQHCICRVAKYPVNNESLKQYLGNKLLEHVYTTLEKANYSSSCMKFDLEEVLLLERFGEASSDKSLYSYLIGVKATVPSNAHFQTVVHYDKTENILQFERVSRLDTYGKTGRCINNNAYERMCHCTKQTD